jgi:hypothetical protein
LEHLLELLQRAVAYRRTVFNNLLGLSPQTHPFEDAFRLGNYPLTCAAPFAFGVSRRTELPPSRSELLPA